MREIGEWTSVAPAGFWRRPTQEGSAGSRLCWPNRARGSSSATHGFARPQSAAGPPLMGGRSVPRFMDLHDGFGGVTREQLKVAQEADWAIEADEGVHFERAWLDPEAGRVFCLSTGPSKEAVMRIHQRAGHPTAEIYELPIEVF